MGIKLTHLAGATVSLLAMAAVSSAAVRAQSIDANAPQTIPDAMDELLSQKSGTFYGNRSFGRQAANIFGFGFRDREILRDGETVAIEVDALMRLQNTSDPTIRVPDLANPYTASLLTLPSSEAPTVGTEFIFEPF
jgi:hypothetical protein